MKIFNINIAKARIKPARKKSKDGKVVNPKPKKEFRFVIYRYMGVADKVLLFVWDKWEGRYTFQCQSNIERGYEMTKYVKRKYKNHKFVDNVTDPVLIEF